MSMFSRMLFLTVAAFLVIVGVCVYAQIPPAPMLKVWEGMFAPPYITNPQIALALDCVSDKKCFIAGGSNGAGFGIFTYDGKMNGNVIGPMQDENRSLMVMDISVGGTEAAPKGAFSSIDFLGQSKGLQYLATPTTWEASAMPAELIWVSESIAGTKDGETFVAIGNSPITGNGLMVSKNGGKNFVHQPFGYKPPAGRFANCSSPGYITMPSANKWFATWSAQPPQHNSNSGSGSKSGSGSGSSSSFNDAGEQQLDAGFDAKYLKADGSEILQARKNNGRMLIIKSTKSGDVRQHFKTVREWRADLKAAEQAAQNDNNQCQFFQGSILTSVDQGRSWKKVGEHPTAATSYVECFDENHCIVTAFNGDESYTMTTTNGEDFKITYTTPAASKTSAEDLQAVSYKSETEVWAGGSKDSQQSGAGMFWKSTDSGMTWTAYPHTIPDIMAVMAMDFSNGVGFALGMTMLKTSQIMRYKDQADYGNFFQKQCPFKGCTILCREMAFPQGMCLTAQGGSAKAFCTDKGLEQLAYTTTSCVGSYKTYIEPTNKCLNGTQNFFENICKPAGSAPRKAQIATDKDVFMMSRH